MKSWNLSKKFFGITKSQKSGYCVYKVKKIHFQSTFFQLDRAESQHIYFRMARGEYFWSDWYCTEIYVVESIGRSWLSMITRSLLELKLGLKGRCYIMVPEGRLLLARFSGFLERARASYRRGLMCIIGRNVHFFNVNIILRAQLNWQTMGSKSLRSRMVQ